MTTVHKVPSDGTRNFKYRLTAKKAKANLLKGAKRKHIGVEHKQGATNIDFSDGSWIKAVLPEVLQWDRGNRKFSYGDLDIEVIEAKPGIENEAKHMDYKFVFIVNGQRIVLHAYNGKQRLTVCGQNYVNFVEKFLQPFFSRKIDHVMSEATKFNEEVLAKLGKTVKRSSVKYKTTSPFSCSISQLHEHMRATHEESVNSTTALEIRHSTRNNSLDNSLINDDISLSALLNDSDDTKEEEEVIVLDESSELEKEDNKHTGKQTGQEASDTDDVKKQYKCEVWIKDASGFLNPCIDVAYTADDMLNHMNSVHNGKKEKEDVAAEMVVSENEKNDKPVMQIEKEEVDVKRENPKNRIC